jgi:hypothetical protein
MLEADRLSPDRLARRVDDALEGNPAEVAGIDVSGAEETARILSALDVKAR